MGVVIVAWIAAASFLVSGEFVPGSAATVTLHGAVSPFHSAVMSDSKGRFRFGKVEEGQYTLIVFRPGFGEWRRTIDIGPSNADTKGRVFLAIKIDDTGLTPDRTPLVSVRELQIPKAAWNAYFAAQKELKRRDVTAAVAHLKRAVEIEPRFVSGWNLLGTISYQTRDYEQAEAHFRKALAIEPEAFEPLVNLGGTLLSRGNFSEAWNYNLHAVLKRPNDALANSQMGMTYFETGKFDLAEKYLLEARRLDPAHFSYPQILLAEIYLRRGDKAAAAAQLEDFLRHHPDGPAAARIRSQLEAGAVR